ncbi:hypothetical protein WR25_03770 [Diploscapter pachys]|uniref:Alpha-carbonic anhydrase domain-containing protein n=1 Tax=Diploscapter pachys TaxID=2018661 RepID=A0A2A2LND0_9BILA|nr:hypothetical protein WR25_03770 [Diploscapter pachys]
MCTIGHLQSPINLDPSHILYDPHLLPIQISDHRVDLNLENTGQLPIATVIDTSKESVNITGGPASPYNYKLHQIIIHFGKAGGEKGSEHTVDRVRFPAEIQLFAYNSELYHNWTDARKNPRGILAISVLVEVGKKTRTELRRLTVASQSVTHKGQNTTIKQVHPLSLIPRTAHYVTYEGSLTYPGCEEVVTWVIINNPLYITHEDLSIWNELQKSETKQAEAAPMWPTYRPLRALNGRLLRTNINIANKGGSCTSHVFTDLGYRANPARHNYGNNSIAKRHDLGIAEEAETAFHSNHLAIDSL